MWISHGWFHSINLGNSKLDELVTRTYPLEGINDAFEALAKGEVARSVLDLT